jgi:hypothetical protein
MGVQVSGSFTPTMGARVGFENRLKLVEVPMSDAERSGWPRLSVVRDGVRFLGAIYHARGAVLPACAAVVNRGGDFGDDERLRRACGD